MSSALLVRFFSSPVSLPWLVYFTINCHLLWKPDTFTAPFPVLVRRGHSDPVEGLVGRGSVPAARNKQHIKIRQRQIFADSNRKNPMVQDILTIFSKTFRTSQDDDFTS